MKTPASEVRYNYARNLGGGKKLYLHFTAMQWTPHPEYAWRGNIDQLLTVIKSKTYKKIAQADAKAVKCIQIKR